MAPLLPVKLHGALRPVMLSGAKLSRRTRQMLRATQHASRRVRGLSSGCREALVARGDASLHSE